MTTRTVHPHGDNRRYLYNRCRCDDCRTAHTEDMRRRRRAIAYGRWEGLVDATGTRRRLQALAAVGWSFTYIARRRSIDPSSIRAFVRCGQAKVQATTARAYAVLYDELCTSDGPAKQTCGWARKYGWHGPEAWTDETIDDPDAEPITQVVDEVAVARAIAGNEEVVVALNRAERLEATRRLVRRGAEAGSISRQLRVSGKTAAKLVGAVRGEAA